MQQTADDEGKFNNDVWLYI